MKRRTACRIITAGVMCSIGFGAFYLVVKKHYKSIRGALIDRIKKSYQIPSESSSISLEKALNSRCTSDDDKNPKKFHWGQFNRWYKITHDQMKDIVSKSIIPRFSNSKLEILIDENKLSFVLSQKFNHDEFVISMVETGMLQQAVCIVCAVMGIGMVFRDRGKNGQYISEKEFLSIEMKIGPMIPPYGDSFWTVAEPPAPVGMIKGNLPEPIRDSKMSAINVLSELKTKSSGSKLSNSGEMGQLLWAGRGRTPHYYKSKPWGMTIPTWAGEQNISSLYVVRDGGIFKYINWHSNRPAHELNQIMKLTGKQVAKIINFFNANSAIIVIAVNEDYNRSIWEVGYQLINIIAQASSMKIAYGAIILNDSSKEFIKKQIGLLKSIAVVSI